MRSVMKTMGEGLPEMVGEAGLGLVGAAALFLLVSPTGRQWFARGTACAVSGVAVAGGAIASLFGDLRQGWAELIQDVHLQMSNGSKQAQ